MSDVHAFTLGSFRCWIIADSVRTFVDQHGSTIINASDAELAAELARYNAATGADPYVSGTNILLIDNGQQRIIVDTGDGFDSEPGFGLLLERLDKTGIDPSSIDVVVITHGHGDHIGACAADDGLPVFPHARYVMTAAEWEFRTATPSLAARANLLPLADRFELIAPDAEIVPGVRAVPMPGHSPGHIGLMIESDGEQLLHMVDCWHHPVQLAQPDWHFGYDADPAQATRTRREILALAASDERRVLAYHAAFPGLGSVHADGDAWRWEPPDIR